MLLDAEELTAAMAAGEEVGVDHATLDLARGKLREATRRVAAATALTYHATAEPADGTGEKRAAEDAPPPDDAPAPSKRRRGAPVDYAALNAKIEAEAAAKRAAADQ